MIYSFRLGLIHKSLVGNTSPDIHVSLSPTFTHVLTFLSDPI